MALTRMIVELGMGTDLRGSDYTKAAIRALKDALWHNLLTIAPALGRKPEDIERHGEPGDGECQPEGR